MKKRRTFGRLIALALLALFLVWIFPRLKNLPRIVGLYREPPPASLPVPVQGIAPSQLTDTWGAARSGGRRHEGIDVFARRGTPVIAATHGLVVRKGPNWLGGRTVGVLGPAGWYHYYAHLDAWSAVGLGDWVEVGTVLGYVGDSGNAKGTPTHLHYGIYVQGEARNPYPLLVSPHPRPLSRPLPPSRTGRGEKDRFRSALVFLPRLPVRCPRPSPHPRPSPVPSPLPRRERGERQIPFCFGFAPSSPGEGGGWGREKRAGVMRVLGGGAAYFAVSATICEDGAFCP